MSRAASLESSDSLVLKRGLRTRTAREMCPDRSQTLANDLPPSAHQPPDTLCDCGLLQRAISDAKVAAVVHPERRSGKHGDAVFADEALGEGHGVHRRVDLHEAIERSVGQR